jgi:catechol 2,3-dioxygenase-like lactoylglutathione lyase family enzyme
LTIKYLTFDPKLSTRQEADMHVLRLDHATINTADLQAALDFYDHYLELRPGWRPPFNVGGAWLYPAGGDYPILHLIEADQLPAGGMFDHVAFRSVGLDDYLVKVKAAGEWYSAKEVPETSLVQIHHFDPNHVRIEITFDGEPLDPAEVRV